MTDLAEALALLDLETLTPTTFRGAQLEARRPRMFGGQVLAQALVAANLTVPAGRLPNSLHAYFIRPGDSTIPIVFKVALLRDGGAFSARRVSALQNDEVILELVTSSCVAMEDLAFQRPMPVAPPAESLAPIQEQLAPYADELDGWWVRPRPFDMRYIGLPPRAALDHPEPAEPSSQIWLRPRGPVPDDPILSYWLLAYISDTTLLDSVMLVHGRTTMGRGSVASLDHAIWFHHTPQLDDWLLYDQHSPGGASRRGPACGHMHQSDGRLVCTVSQEGYLSPTAPRNWTGPRMKNVSRA